MQARFRLNLNSEVETADARMTRINKSLEAKLAG
jgi:hypothetical protein